MTKGGFIFLAALGAVAAFPATKEGFPIVDGGFSFGAGEIDDLFGYNITVSWKGGSVSGLLSGNSDFNHDIGNKATPGSLIFRYNSPQIQGLFENYFLDAHYWFTNPVWPVLFKQGVAGQGSADASIEDLGLGLSFQYSYRPEEALYRVDALDFHFQVSVVHWLVEELSFITEVGGSPDPYDLSGKNFDFPSLTQEFFAAFNEVEYQESVRENLVYYVEEALNVLSPSGFTLSGLMSKENVKHMVSSVVRSKSTQFLAVAANMLE